ncbi:MAG: DUF5714 domain-containing protein [Thermodesulfobacteriota bacterium]|nr:DUF5714 domain-containing protein [Thermodesulfobacteriota bacterium]
MIYKEQLHEHDHWIRLEHAGTPVYVRPDIPDWVIPNTAGDALMQALSADEPDGTGGAVPGIMEHWGTRRFLSLLTSPPVQPYTGRADVLCLDALEECWLHITDRCNLSCRHCLFACSDKTKATLPLETVATIVADACDLGARTFYLTGGEPLVHPDFQAICRMILEDRPDTRLVILTNGILIPEQLDFFQTLPANRLFLQISVDGIGGTNDHLRGKGTYEKLRTVFDAIKGHGPTVTPPVTLAMAVHAANFHQMPDMVDLAAHYGFSGVHYMWLLITGKAKAADFVTWNALFASLIRCHEKAEARNITIDNIQNMAARVFATPGTRHDLSNAGWTSLAIGPDGAVYPTPALIGQSGLICGEITGKQDLEYIWRESAVLKALRGLSLLADEQSEKDPLRFIIGGGDIDQSYYAGGAFVGHDPYMSLYRAMALWLMAKSAEPVPDSALTDAPRLRRKMGEKLMQCHHDGQGVALTHSNCVLTFAGTRQVVGDFYTIADETDNPDIINPVCYPESELSHIPVDGRVRSYGCGSPVLDAGIAPGEVVMDLGAGAGVECFIAARKTGPDGQVIGLDMLDHMLTRASQSLDAVADNLGYCNVTFKKGLLEAIPVDDNTVDVIISNCVINLSEDKRQTFAEIFRVLKPGGRIFISDVVTDSPCPPSIQNDATLRGECIAGALVQPHLMAILEAAGFHQTRIVKRFFYREVRAYRFYSVTYTAFKPPATDAARPVVYPGPYAAVVMDSGQVLTRGEPLNVNWSYPANNDPAIFTLDAHGGVDNMTMENTCCAPTAAASKACDCSAPPEEPNECGCGQPPVPPPPPGNGISILTEAPPAPAQSGKVMADCMVCGKPLQYLKQDRPEPCALCGRVQTANAVCEAGHFVCDACHSRDMSDIVKHICTHTDAADMIDLLNRLRSHPCFPVNGPEHHFAVPGIILAVYRNLGGAVTGGDILAGIDRGKAIPGGVCAVWGACGAALGVGVAFGIMLKSTPLAPTPRQMVQRVTDTVIQKINMHEAARCCQRETFTALKAAAELSKTLLPVELKADGDVQCRQQGKNRECIRQACPYFSYK